MTAAAFEIDGAQEARSDRISKWTGLCEHDRVAPVDHDSPRLVVTPHLYDGLFSASCRTNGPFRDAEVTSCQLTWTTYDVGT